MDNKDFRTDFAKAKNYGSAKSGSHHWLAQRLTALILIASVFWIFYLGNGLSGASMGEIAIEIQKPFNLIALMVFILCGFYHGSLGMQVIIEDYVSCIIGRNILIILVRIFSFVTIISSLAALTYLMVL